MPRAMNPSVTDIEARVKKIVADALDVSIDQVHPHASLVADLNAESIDFLDLTYRLESEFDVRIPEEEIWRGSVDTTDDASIARGIAQLRLRMPDFPWHRVPERVTRADLPVLITVQTIVDYLVRRLDGASP
jgi:acyl carrier protein